MEGGLGKRRESNPTKTGFFCFIIISCVRHKLHGRGVGGRDEEANSLVAGGALGGDEREDRWERLRHGGAWTGDEGVRTHTTRLTLYSAEPRLRRVKTPPPTHLISPPQTLLNLPAGAPAQGPGRRSRPPRPTAPQASRPYAWSKLWKRFREGCLW